MKCPFLMNITLFVFVNGTLLTENNMSSLSTFRNGVMLNLQLLKIDNVSQSKQLAVLNFVKRLFISYIKTLLS